MTLSFREAARITPWGDSYGGYTPGGAEVEIERSYLWEDAPGGPILCEVIVRAPDGLEARAAALIGPEAV